MNREELIEQFNQREVAQAALDTINAPIWSACQEALQGWYGPDRFNKDQDLYVEDFELNHGPDKDVVRVTYSHYHDKEYKEIPISVVTADDPRAAGRVWRAEVDAQKEAEAEAKREAEERARAKELLDKYPDLRA